MQIRRITLFLCSLALGMLIVFLGLESAQSSPASIYQYQETFTDYKFKSSSDQAVWDIWQHQVRMARPNGNLNSASAFYWLDAGLFSDGSMLVVWADSRTGSSHIYAQRLDPRGNRLWEKDIQVDSGWSAEYPTVTISPDDIAYILFYGEGPLYGPCIQKINLAGEHLLETEANIGEGVGFIAGGQGYLYLAWGMMGPTYTTIYLQRLDSDGTLLWEQPKIITTEADVGIFPSQDVEVDAMGNAVIGWRGQANLFSQKVSPEGNFIWEQAAQVNATAFEATGGFVLDTDHAGNIIYAWQTGAGSKAQKLDAEGSPAWASEAVVPGDHMWDMAVGPDGGAVIVTIDSAGVYKLDANGAAAWTEAVQLAENRVANILYPALEVGADNQILGAWSEWTETGGEIYASTIGADGQRQWAADSRVTYDDGVANQSLPSLAAGPEGSAFITWLDKRDPLPRIYTQRMDLAGNRLWQTEIWVDRQNQELRGLTPVIVSRASHDSVYVVWKAAPTWSYGPILIQKIDPQGNLGWASPVTWGESGTGQPAGVVDSGGNLWLARTIDKQVWVQRIQPDGSFAWETDQQVNLDASRQVNQPAIGMDAEGNVIVAWVAPASEGVDIMAQAINSNGQPVWGEDLTVNAELLTWIGSDIYARIAGNMSQGWSIFWVHGSSSLETNLYGQRISPAGEKLWNTAGDMLVHASHPFANTDFEAVAQPGGTIHVAINTSAAYNCVSLLTVSTNGETLHSKEICSARLATYPAVMPVEGAVWSAWQDAGQGNWSILTYLTTPEGVDIWDTPLPVIAQETFSFEAGNAVSENVNVSGQDIIYANLTAETELNGGQLTFYLSNTGGDEWLRITPGQTVVFTTTGSDLRWRVELLADPLWPRSPTVEKVNIVYGTSLEDADDYEPDDLCDLAQPIAANGTPQLHSLPAGDQDWVRLDVPEAGLFMASAASTITDTIQPVYQLEVKLDCSSEPVQVITQTTATSTDILWVVQEAGTAYIHVQAQDETTGLEEYHFSVRELDTSPMAVVVVSEELDPNLQESYNLSGDLAYRTLLTTREMTKDRIIYLSPGPERDADLNGFMDDIYGPPSTAALQWAIEDWALAYGLGFGQPFYLLLIGNGQVDEFLPSPDDPLTSTSLDLWLTNLEATTGVDRLNIILDFAYSGSMIEAATEMGDTISGPHRTIIASASASQVAHFGEGASEFGTPFFTALAEGQSLHAAFQTAGEALFVAGIDQTPWLDDNGDGIATPWTPAALIALSILEAGVIEDGEAAQGRGLNLYSLPLSRFTFLPMTSKR